MAAAKITETLVRGLESRATRYDVRDSELKGLVLRVTPTGHKTWSISYRNGQGRAQRFTLGTWPAVKVKRARDLATERLGQIAGGRDIVTERKRAREVEAVPTLADFIDGAYGEHLDAHHRTPRETRRRLKNTFPWNNRKLDQIDQKSVEQWRAQRIRSGRKPSTVNRDLNALKALLARAVEWRLIDANPLANLKPVKELDGNRVRYLSPEEEKRLRKALAIAPDYLAAIVLIAMNTGMRRGELFKLNWDSVNLQARQLTVEAGSAKTWKVRHIPLNREALAVLQWWGDDRNQAGLVFPSKTGASMTNFKRSWATLMAAARIDDFTFHCLRHHFASRLVMAGIDLNTVRELLGHGDIRMTLRYSHLAPEHKAAAVEVL